MVRANPDDARLRDAGLRRVAVEGLVIQRRRCGKGFMYLDGRGRRIADARELARIRSLAIPPNYADVRIAADPRAHLQAVGQDDAGRIQYRYHPDWEIVRELEKVDRLATLSRSIGRIRRRVARDLASPGPSRTKALAAVVTVVDRTHIRIGCEDYVHSGRSRGAATLLKRNMRIDGDALAFAFRGKGGRPIECRVEDAPALVRAIEELRRLPGRRLFQYRDAGGTVRQVAAGDVNAYLREVSGAPVTTKDFRTLAATAEAGVRLAGTTPAGSATARRRQVAAVMRDVAELLGNTPAVARKSYVHRRMVEAFAEGRLGLLYAGARSRPHRSRGEALVASLFAEPDRTSTRGRKDRKEQTIVEHSREHATP